MTTNPGKDLRWLFFGWSGRLSKQAYVLMWLFWFCAFAIPVTMAVRVESGSQAQTLVGFALIAIAAAGILSVLAASAKRLHDINVRGVFALVLFVPGIAIPAIVVLGFWPTSHSPNRFGPRTDHPGH